MVWTSMMDLSDLIKPEAVIGSLKANSKKQAIQAVAEKAAELTGLPEREIFDTLLQREKLGSTGVGAGVAIPHVKLRGIERVACSLAVHPGGLPWQAIDGAPVHILFAVLRPDKAGVEHDPERHLEMMRWVSRLARDADFRRFALRVKTKTELVDLLKEMSAV